MVSLVIRTIQINVFDNRIRLSSKLPLPANKLSFSFKGTISSQYIAFERLIHWLWYFRTCNDDFTIIKRFEKGRPAHYDALIRVLRRDGYTFEK